MERLRIGIVEDELIVAYDMITLLTGIGYECLEPCADHDAAIAMLTATPQPDIVLLDVNLGGHKDGIDVARFVRQHLDIPIIFVTANSDTATVARAREVLPDAYLVKPFHKANLYTAIEVAIFSYSKRKEKDADRIPGKKRLQDALFIKDGEYFHKVSYNDILYLSSNQNYVTVHTPGRNYLVRATMQDYMAQLDQARILRVHRSFAVNIQKVEKINSVSVVVGGHDVPVSRNYADHLLEQFNIS